MEGLWAAGVVILFLVIGLGLWALSSSMDRDRITQYIQERGGRVVGITWAPFGKGWFGDKNDRIYEVVYYDADGRQHFATCKTSMWAGVYWTEDRVTHDKPDWYGNLPERNEPGRPLIHHIGGPPAEAPPQDEVQRLREENARLRAELERRQREQP